MKRFEKILFFITWFLLTSGFLTLFNLKSIIPSTLIEQDFNTLEFSTIKQVNEELSYLKKWSTSGNELLRKDADELLRIRSKELKYIVASRYATVTNEIYNGYKALEKYFEEISKFYSPIC